MGKYPAIKRGEAVVFNMDDTPDGAGTHWCAYYHPPKSGKTLYYDSFGMPPPPALEEHFHDGEYQYNPYQIQNVNTSNCGYLCLDWLIRVMEGETSGDVLTRQLANSQAERD